MTRARSSALPLLLLFGVAVASLVLVGGWVPLEPCFLEFAEWLRRAGALGVCAFALAYVVATVAMVPGAVLTLLAGFLYGPIWGTVLVSPASVIGAALAFLLGRSWARPWVVARVAARPEFSAIDAAIAAQGFRIVFLLRLSPLIPFNLLNYALALTGVSFWPYVAASAIGMLPWTFLYSCIGAAVPNAAQLLRGPTAFQGTHGDAMYWFGLLATVVATIMASRASSTALRVSLASASTRTGETAASSNSAQR